MNKKKSIICITLLADIQTDSKCSECCDGDYKKETVGIITALQIKNFRRVLHSPIQLMLKIKEIIGMCYLVN
jgi:hypothetical protein